MPAAARRLKTSTDINLLSPLPFSTFDIDFVIQNLRISLLPKVTNMAFLGFFDLEMVGTLNALFLGGGSDYEVWKRSQKTADDGLDRSRPLRDTGHCGCAES